MMVEATERERHDDVRALLKTLRCRLDPATRTLGSHERLMSRRGRRVSQEEMAEAVGVSRTWYSLLESGAPVQPSVSMLERLAAALQATPDERTALFHLAIPALQRVLPTETHHVFDSLSFVRGISNRLWLASSEDEALVIAAEHLANWFTDAPLIVTAKRLRAGDWDCRRAVDRGVRKTWDTYIDELCNRLSAQHIDTLNGHPRLQWPGETDDDETLKQYVPEVRRISLDAMRRNRLDLTAFIQARVSSRQGLIASLHVRHHTGRSYSEQDRAVLGATAQLASLALS